jgi:hypothetical protein
MTFFVKKRGKTYRLEGRVGERARRGGGERERFRLSLGTGNGEAAQICHSKIERALAEGRTSPLWRELKALLPPDTFEKLSNLCGYVAEAPRLTWQELSDKFTAWLTQRVAIGKLRDSTKARYLQTTKSFGAFLTERGIVGIDDVTRSVVEDFKAWRLKSVLAKKFSRGGHGVVLDTAILHRAFAYAIECELLTRNPVRLDGRPGDDPERGAQPFKGDELQKLRQAAGADLLAFLPDNGHAAGTTKARVLENNLKIKDLVAGEPVSRNLRAHLCFQ